MRKNAARPAEPAYIVALGDGTVYAPPLSRWTLDGLRHVMPRQAVDPVLASLRLPCEPVESVRVYRHRIRTGDPFQVASVVRDLGHLKRAGALSRRQQAIHDHALMLLAQEIAAATGDDSEVVEAEIRAISTVARD